MCNSFTGFKPEMLDFLFQLGFENTIEKQEENLPKYKDLISQPLNNLYKDLLPVISQISDKLETKPARCVSSPYTDRRFNPTTPFKDYMYIRFRELGKTEQIAGLYFDMGIDYYSYGLRMYRQSTKGMEQIREKILGNPKGYHSQLELVSKAGFNVIGEKYKKDHFTEISDNVIKEILNSRRFYIGKDVPINDNVFSSKLAEELAQGFMTFKGLINLLTEI